MAISLEVTDLNVLLLLYGAFILCFGSVSYLLKEKVALSEAPVALAAGIAFGPYGLGSIFKSLLAQDGQAELEQLDSFTLGLSRVVIGIQLVLVGVQLPLRYLVTEWQSLLWLLFPVMTGMWLCTTGCLAFFFPSVPLLALLVIAACLTPTDPVLSNSIVQGSFADRYVPGRLRNLISGESGSNDGLGYLFLFLPIQLIQHSTSSSGKAVSTWLVENVLYQVGGAIVYGAAVGYAACLVLRWATKHDLIDRESYLLYAIAVGALVVGSAGMLDMDDLLAAFVAGNTLSWDDVYRKETADDQVQPTIDLLLNIVFFVFVGAAVPFDKFDQPELGITPTRLVALGAAILLLRRPPTMLLFYRFIPSVTDWSEALFLGYMGPIGAGAIFYSAHVLDMLKSDEPDPPQAQVYVRLYVKPISYAMVLASMVGHSLMVPVLKLIFERTEMGKITLGDEEDLETIGAADGREDAGGQSEDGHAQSDGADEGGGHAASDEGARRRRPSMTDSETKQHICSWRLSTGHRLEAHGTWTTRPDGTRVFEADPSRPTLRRNPRSQRDDTSPERRRSRSRTSAASEHDPMAHESSHRLH